MKSPHIGTASLRHWLLFNNHVQSGWCSPSESNATTRNGWKSRAPECIKQQTSTDKIKCFPCTRFYPQAALVSWWVTLCSDSSWTGLQCQILKEPGKEITIFKVSFNYILRIFETSNCIGKKSLQTTTPSHHHILHWRKKYHSKAAHVGHALGICCSREHLLALMKVSWSVHESLFAGF